MHLTMSHDLDASIEKCWRMFVDPRSHIAKFTEMGHREIEIVECEATDDRIHLVIERLVDADIPPFARRVFQPTSRVRSVDDWVRNDDGTCDGTFDLEFKGAPVESSGTTQLSCDGSLTRYVIDVEVDVRVPVIGRRVSPIARGILEQQLTAEFRLADEWLSTH